MGTNLVLWRNISAFLSRTAGHAKHTLNRSICFQLIRTTSTNRWKWLILPRYVLWYLYILCTARFVFASACEHEDSQKGKEWGERRNAVLRWLCRACGYAHRCSADRLHFQSSKGFPLGSLWGRLCSQVYAWRITDEFQKNLKDTTDIHWYPLIWRILGACSTGSTWAVENDLRRAGLKHKLPQHQPVRKKWGAFFGTENYKSNAGTWSRSFFSLKSQLTV